MSEYPFVGPGWQLLLAVCLIGSSVACVYWMLRATRAEQAIRKHRDQHADDRCWMDDAELYAALPEGHVLPETFEVGDKAAMLKNCERYVNQRCFGGPWKSYVELEQENQALRDKLSHLEKLEQHRQDYDERVPDPRRHKYFNPGCMEGCQFLKQQHRIEALQQAVKAATDKWAALDQQIMAQARQQAKPLFLDAAPYGRCSQCGEALPNPE